MQRCTFCKNTFSQVWQHEPFCKSNPTRKTKNVNSGGRCSFCRKIYSQVGLHEVYCFKNPVRKSRTENSFNRYTAARRDGKPVPKMSKAEKQSFIANCSTYWTTGDVAAKKRKHSKAMLSAVKRNPKAYSSKYNLGNVKCSTYKGIQLHSSWELQVARLLDAEGLRWTRPSLGIPYKWKRSDHLYFPDFYVKGYRLFVEVKGYETSRDRAKWRAVDRLLVIKKDELASLTSGATTLRKLLAKRRKEIKLSGS